MHQTFKTLAIFQYSSEALILKGRLEAEGIKVFLRDNVTIDTDPLVSNAIGGVKLDILAIQEKEALEILKTIKHNTLSDSEEFVSCPICDNEDITMFSIITSAKSLLKFIFEVAFKSRHFYTKHKYRCQNCLYEFDLKQKK